MRLSSDLNPGPWVQLIWHAPRLRWQGLQTALATGWVKYGCGMGDFPTLGCMFSRCHDHVFPTTFPSLLLQPVIPPDPVVSGVPEYQVNSEGSTLLVPDPHGVSLVTSLPALFHIEKMVYHAMSTGGFSQLLSACNKN